MNSDIIPKLFGTSPKKGAKLYSDILNSCDEYTGEPHKLVLSVMEKFDAATEGSGDQSKKSLRGSVFEYVVGEVLLLEKVTPLYHQAELLYVPLAKFDWFLYHSQTPVSISCKTTARERWKQAAYEGMALKRVYPQSENYMVTFEKPSSVDKKKEEAPQTIDHFVTATSSDFDEVVKTLGEKNFHVAKELSPIVGRSKLVEE